MNSKIESLDVLRYYVCYKDIEEPILNMIKSKNPIDRETGLKKYMNNHMGIGRNFAAGKQAMILGATQNYYRTNGRSADELSDIYFRNELLNANIKNAKVAASKLLWLYNPSVVIMDNLNRRVLGVKGNTYKEYEEAWLMKFSEVSPNIEKIINENNLSSIDKVVTEDWFKMRVFDQYLWTLGVKNLKLE